MTKSTIVWLKKNRDAIIRSVLTKVILALGSLVGVLLAARAAGLGERLTAASAFVWEFLNSPVSLPWGIQLVLIFCTSWTIGRPILVFFRKPSVRQYREDVFQGVRAKWKWELFRLEPKDIKVLCPVCSTRLVYDEDFAVSYRANFIIPGTQRSVVCETCDRKIADGDVEGIKFMVGRQIERVLETGEWKDRVGKG